MLLRLKSSGKEWKLKGISKRPLGLAFQLLAEMKMEVGGFRAVGGAS